MKIKVLFNDSNKSNDLSCGWGLSFLIDNRVIFDTGENGDSLMNNINKLKVDISLVKDIVISHDHWDHTGGLWELIKEKTKSNVYGCPGFGLDFKDRISKSSIEYFEVDRFARISDGIYSTGEILGAYKGKNITEQALIIKTEKGFSVITGCAHPGIIKILERVRTQLSVNKFYAVFGGFHLKDHSVKEIEEIMEKLVEFKVGRIGATHCSGSVAENIFKDMYQEHFLSMNVGDELTI